MSSNKTPQRSRVILADNIKRLLKQRGMTAVDLEKKTQISTPHISRIIHARTNVTVDKLTMIADALNVPPPELLELK